MSNTVVIENDSKLSEVEIILRLNGILPAETQRKAVAFDFEERPIETHNRIQKALGKANCFSLNKIPIESSELILGN